MSRSRPFFSSLSSSSSSPYSYHPVTNPLSSSKGIGTDSKRSTADKTPLLDSTQSSSSTVNIEADSQTVSSSPSTSTPAMKRFQVLLVLYLLYVWVLLFLSFFTLFQDSVWYIRSAVWFVLYLIIAVLYGCTLVVYVVYYWIQRVHLSYAQAVRAYQTMMVTLTATFMYALLAIVSYYVYSSVSVQAVEYPMFRAMVSFGGIMSTPLLGSLYLHIFLPDVVRSRP